MPATPSTPTTASTTTPVDPQAQRDALLDNERKANSQQPRNFKEDALQDKVVTVGPDGTGPTPTETFDAGSDQQAGSGSGEPAASKR